MLPARLHALPIGRNRVICEISAEALNDHFGALSLSGVDLVAAFERNRDVIEETARAMLPVKTWVGRCLLVSAEL